MDGGWAHLPQDILEYVGTFLRPCHLSAARSACRHWREHITAAICDLDPFLELDMSTDSGTWHRKIETTAAILPQVKQFMVYVSSRISQDTFDAELHQLARLRPCAEVLELRFMTPNTPVLGERLQQLSTALTLFSRLQTLWVAMGNTPAPPRIAALSSLQRLEDLKLLSGQLHYGFMDDHVEALAAVTSLRRAEFEAADRALSAASLSCLTCIRGLRCLVVHGLVEGPALEGVGRLVAGCSELTEIRLSVEDESVVTLLPSLAPRSCCLHLDLTGRQGPGAAGAAALMHPAIRAGTWQVLQGLHLRDVVVAADLLLHLAALRRLRLLEVSAPQVRPGTAVSGHLGLLAALTDLHSLTVVLMPGHPVPALHLSLPALRQLSTACTRLHTLTLWQCVRDGPVLRHLSAFSSLTNLSLQPVTAAGLVVQEGAGSEGGGGGVMSASVLPGLSLNWLPTSLTSLELSQMNVFWEPPPRPTSQSAPLPPLSGLPSLAALTLTDPLTDGLPSTHARSAAAAPQVASLHCQAGLGLGAGARNESAILSLPAAMGESAAVGSAPQHSSSSSSSVSGTCEGALQPRDAAPLSSSAAVAPRHVTAQEEEAVQHVCGENRAGDASATQMAAVSPVSDVAATSPASLPGGAVAADPPGDSAMCSSSSSSSAHTECPGAVCGAVLACGGLPPALEHLSLQDCPRAAQTMAVIAPWLTSLRSLELSRVRQLNDAALSTLSHFTHLTSLRVCQDHEPPDVSAGAISQAGLLVLRRLRELRYLSFITWGCASLETRLIAALSTLRRLQVLVLPAETDGVVRNATIEQMALMPLCDMEDLEWEDS